MGVPKFFRWLSERYPLINQNIEDSTLLPEFDRLYLDMNGILHNATHGNEGVSRVLSEKDVMLKMISYIDMIVKIVKPKEVLYMAIDGVAPRAKMNQQRSRRFRAAKDLAQEREKARQRGEEINDEDVFDSNCITPGTEFMAKVSKHLKYFIRKKLHEDPVWQRLRIVFSGHEVPGEGEHKIMDFIRAEKSQPGYNPNTKHCMAGLDADLIMLSLATHEPHFSLLREHIDFTAFSRNKYATKEKTRQLSDVKWELLHISLLREYLEMDMRPQEIPIDRLPFAYDGERAIDDFVLLTVLCGNDFVPHLPSLDVGEGAMDDLFRSYRKYLPSLGGYLVDRGEINFERVETILTDVAQWEPQILQDRKERLREIREREQKTRHLMRDRGYEVEDSDNESESSGSMLAPPEAFEDDDGGNGAAEDTSVEETPLPSEDDDEEESDENELPNMTTDASVEQIMAAREKLDREDLKGQYYLDKFGIGPGIPGSSSLKQKLVQSFAEALQWVMYYYYRGVPSWGWFYPFHYAPMTSDLQNLDSLQIEFSQGRPFLPFQQLLGCLPSASAKFLPPAYQRLMTAENSPLAEFYPGVNEIMVDMNGKINPWEGVTLIPFIQESKMLDAIEKHCPPESLTEAERQRNSFGYDYEFWHDPSGKETVQSTLPEYFPTLESSQSRVRTYRLPAIPGDGLFSPVPAAGCVVPAAGFPSLHSLPLKPYLKKVAVQILSRRSRMESLILAVGTGRNEDPEVSDMPLHRPTFSVQYSSGTSVTSLDKFCQKTPDVHEEAIDDACSAFPYESAEAASQELVGQIVYVDWPHMHVGQVIGVSDCEENFELIPEGGVGTTRIGDVNVRHSKHSIQRKQRWASEVEDQRKRLLTGGQFLCRAGISIGNVQVLVKVKKLVGMRRDATTGELRRVFAESGSSGEVTVPDQVIVLRHPSPDLRFKEQGPLPVEERFPIGEQIVMLRQCRGCSGTVMGHEKAAETVTPRSAFGVHLTVKCEVIRESYPVFEQIAHDQRFDDTYISAGEIANELNVSPSVIGQLTGTVKVKGANPRAPRNKRQDDYADIGLNLKVHKDYYLPGYARLLENTSSKQPATGNDFASVLQSAGKATFWGFSKKARNLLHRYKNNFPEVIKVLESQQGQSGVRISDFGGGSAVQKVLDWLDQLEIRKKKLVPVSSSVLSEQAIKAIQVTADRMRQSRQHQEKVEYTTIHGVAPEDVFAPEHWGYAVGNIGGADAVGNSLSSVKSGGSVQALHNGTPRLGDRVVNLTTRHVPLGLRGTVVVVHPSTQYVEVVWDSEFVGGHSLEGLCSNGRGSLSSWASVLNLTRAASSSVEPEKAVPGTSQGADERAVPNSSAHASRSVGAPVPKRQNGDSEGRTRSNREGYSDAKQDSDNKELYNIASLLEDLFIEATEGTSLSAPAEELAAILKDKSIQGFVKVAEIIKCWRQSAKGSLSEAQVMRAVKQVPTCLQVDFRRASIRRAKQKGVGYVPRKTVSTKGSFIGKSSSVQGSTQLPEGLAPKVQALFLQAGSLKGDSGNFGAKAAPSHPAPRSEDVQSYWESLKPASSKAKTEGEAGMDRTPRMPPPPKKPANFGKTQGDNAVTQQAPDSQETVPPVAVEKSHIAGHSIDTPTQKKKPTQRDPKKKWNDTSSSTG
eukprot:gb/GECG01005147.1/.p1 GENE.gb/GECG01005147.1/~~gb/GECG01005147.1/.p1  ORF type:complete len:1649 (+),score=221.87 gb/GECG01005147.1/:1-4947(+)